MFMQRLLSYTMEVYLCILLAIGAYSQNLDHIDIPVNSAGIENTPDISDQNTASGINTNNYYGGIGGPDYDVNSHGNRYSGRYFGKNVEELVPNRRSGADKFGKPARVYEHYKYDDGNPDIHGIIQRPCQSYDTFCIRKFFAEHSQCKISGRQVPEPLYRAQTTFNVPNVNMSAIMTGLEYTGIKDGRIEEFYIDKATDNLVITVIFDRVSMTIQSLNTKYYRRGREPIVTRDPSVATFLKVSATAVIPNLKDLKLDRAEIFAYPGVPIPAAILGPGIPLSTDPEVPATFALFFANVVTSTIEIQATDGLFYLSNFIQYNICDFGLKLI